MLLLGLQGILKTMQEWRPELFEIMQKTFDQVVF